jgi:hypothetical protein
VSEVVADTILLTSSESEHDQVYVMARGEEPCTMMAAVSHLPMLPGPRMVMLFTMYAYVRASM